MFDSIRTGMADAAGKGMKAWFDGAQDSVKAVRLSGWMASRIVDGTIAPTMDATLAMQRNVADAMLATVRGDKALPDAVRETGDRVVSGMRFGQVVNTLGRELLGTATFAGEKVLCEDGAYRLVFLPAWRGVKKAKTSVFHASGGIPYGDSLFRLLPEANLFRPFLSRGVPVYLMELRPERTIEDTRATTMESLVGTYERFTKVAFEHSGKTMVLSGYCGNGTQAWAWIASHPEAARERFHGIVNWVAPIDGRECTSVGELTRLSPSWMTDSSMDTFGRLYGAMPGFAMQSGLDLGLKNLFPKTPFGRFVAGWNQPAWGRVRTVADLTPDQRREVVGAYWISPENAQANPLPLDLVRFSTAIFTKGIAPNGDIPWSIGGEPLSFRTVAERTTLKVLGIYGGRDVVVPDRTGYVLQGVFGDRYRHVVHPQAGHVSYIFSPKQWEPTHPARFDPDPVDLFLSL